MKVTHKPQTQAHQVLQSVGVGSVTHQEWPDQGSGGPMLQM